MIRRIPKEELERSPRTLPLARAPAAAPTPSSGPDRGRRAALTRLLQDELVLAPERVVGLCARELARFPLAAAVSARAHPRDCELLARALGGETRVMLISDPSITRGGCVLTGESGEIDARVETRVERMLAVLLEEER